MGKYINTEKIKYSYLPLVVMPDVFVTKKEIDEMPGEDVAPVVHAHFVPTEYDGYADGNPVWDTWECSNCREEFYNEGDEPDFIYCPYCGAKMDEEVEECIPI